QIVLASAGYSGDYNDYITPTNCSSYNDAKVHFNSKIFFSLLSGYAPAGYRPLTAGFGVNYNGATKPGNFFCPSEPQPIEKHPYGHILSNVYLSGTDYVRGHAQKYWRRLNAITKGSEALHYADNRMATNYQGGPWHNAYRHGFKDPRPINSDASPSSTRGRCNFAFIDGHVESATNAQVSQTWKVDYEMPASWEADESKLKNYFINNKPFFRGFDPSK
ncbi:MAG: hypothetical protein J6S58_02515, partial [Lentisphaeria bacterium]|nr:hypothetical protein [Lentisphaeria bacterium]